jgi:hypothetical protein
MQLFIIDFVEYRRNRMQKTEIKIHTFTLFQRFLYIFEISCPTTNVMRVAIIWVKVKK